MTSALRLHVGVLGHSRGLKLRHVSCTAHRRNLSDGHKKTLHEVCLMEFITSTGSLDKWGSFYRQLIVFFLSWGPGGRQNPLIYQNLSAMFVVVKHPLAGRAPNLSLGQVPWVQAQAAQALRSKLMEETSQTQMKRMCWEGVCMNIYIIYIVFNLEAGCWLEVF